MSETTTFPFYSAYTILRSDDEVLLLRRQNTGHSDGLLSLPAGRNLPGELPKATARRETKEEVATIVLPEHLRLVHTTHRITLGDPQIRRIDYVFEATKWFGEPENNEPDRCSEVGWYPIEELPSDVAPLVGLMIGHVLKGNVYSEHIEV